MYRRTFSHLAMMLILGGGSALPLTAQDETPRTERSQPPAAAADRAATDERRPGRISDAALARWLIHDHRAEIAISRWAEETLDEPQTVAYAKKMIEDHQQMVADLEQAVRDGRSRAREEEEREVTIETPDVDVEVEVDRDNVRDAARRAAEAARRAAERAGERRDERLDRRSDRATDRRARREGQASDAASELRAERRGEGRSGVGADRGRTNWLRIKAQLSDQTVRSSRETLERYSGDERIAAFIGMQLVHHQRMLDTLTVFQEHASPELDRLLEANAEKIQSHLQMAGKLMGEVSRH